MQWEGREKISHLFNRNETKWSKTNLFAYLCCFKSSIRVTMIENNNVYKTIWKNGNKEYYIFLTSDYFAISMPILLFSYSFHIPLYFLTFIFTLYVPFFPFFLIDHNRQHVLLISWVIFFFETQKYFFALFKFLMLFQRWSTLWSSTLKITTFFRRFLMLLISTLK